MALTCKYRLMAKKPDSKDDKATNPLGISRAIYALGNSVKDALIWGTAATAAVIVTANMARKDGNKVDKAILYLEKMNHKPKFVEWMGKNFQKMTGGKMVAGEIVGGKKLDLSAPVVGASLVVGWLVGHLVQLPSGLSGWNQADKAIKKYEGAAKENRDLGSENLQLASLNQALAEQNRQFAAQLEKKPALFTDMVTQSQNEPAAAVGR